MSCVGLQKNLAGRRLSITALNHYNFLPINNHTCFFLKNLIIGNYFT